jgi:hypothetical protein
MEHSDETTRQILAEVFLCVLRPIGGSIATSWRRARHQPLRLPIALLATATWGALGLLYAVAALIVPLTYTVLLTISGPVVVVALIQRAHATPRPAPQVTPTAQLSTVG